jgi:hypothetical protein
MPLCSILPCINNGRIRVYNALDRPPNITFSFHPIHLRHHSHISFAAQQIIFFHTK